MLPCTSMALYPLHQRQQGPQVFAAVVGGLYVPLGPTVSVKRMVMAAPTGPKRKGPRDLDFFIGSSRQNCGARSASRLKAEPTLAD